MNLPYTMRLLCLCCASFFMIHLALAIATRLGAGTAVRIAEHMKPSSAARLLFALRMTPLVLALFAVLAFCIPSYLWLEPEATGEKVGLFCVLTAALGVYVWASALWRVTGAVRGTNRYLHECERHGEKISVPGEAAPALLLSDKTPVLAVAGVLHPQLVISRRVMAGLSQEQREAALSHERAHCDSGDNFKRFLILLAQTPFHFAQPSAASNAPGRNSRSGLPTIRPVRAIPAGAVSGIRFGECCEDGIKPRVATCRARWWVAPRIEGRTDVGKISEPAGTPERSFSSGDADPFET